MENQAFTNSTRSYCISYFDGLNVQVHKPVYLYEFYYAIYNDESDDNLYEWKYACQDMIDAILDLKVGAMMLMYYNRDNENIDKGVIYRIS
jgi:hypothetical protein